MPNSLPKHIYKYVTLNQRFYEMIIRKELWFASPESFNDPFDCNLPWQYHFEDQEMFEFIEKHGIEIQEAGNLEEIKAEAERLSIRYNNEFVRIMKGVGVCCFSAKKDDLIMWAHYADSHKGVQICFEVKLLAENFNIIKNVIYSNHRPIVNPLKNISSAFFPTVIHKSTDWKNEKEVRIISSTPGNYPFEMNALKEIRFGLRCTDHEISTVQKLLRNSGLTHVKCTQAIMSKNLYRFGNKTWAKNS